MWPAQGDGQFSSIFDLDVLPTTSNGIFHTRYTHFVNKDCADQVTLNYLYTAS